MVINGVTYSSNRTLNIYAENIVISTSSAGTVSSTPVTVTIKFTSTKTTGQTWLLAQSVSTSSDISADIEFYVGSTRYTTFYIEGMPGNYIAYISSSDSETVFIDNEWKKEADRTVYFPVAPTGELLTWLQANGTLQGGGVTTETWILNESLTATESFDSGNLDDDHIFQTPGYMDGTGPGFNRITFQYNDETNSYMRYRLKKAEAKVAYVKDSDGERWTSEGWRTLIFDKPVTDTDLLAWLQANGVKQGGGADLVTFTIETCENQELKQYTDCQGPANMLFSEWLTSSYNTHNITYPVTDEECAPDYVPMAVPAEQTITDGVTIALVAYYNPIN